MHLPRTTRFAALTTLALLAGSPLARADDCNTGGFEWSRTTPAINVRSIFCGEIKGPRVAGFHSTQLRSSSVVTSIGHKSSQHQGIYTASVTFKSGRSKWSTFFPDHCSYDQIVASVVHAANDRQGDAQPWASGAGRAPTAMPASA
ncbi:EndoU domain-containing protein [Chitinimonas koreensis]|uniref:EndoU domain-containing protein n=1 Tax=Chitinimonas koreensis TaxID=356302 RepID=UPI001653F461|nr:EndoU domain-containing protein [Chitinimonas koreensis]QNM94772.1 EndoU domain-containing protein [Chitinimonas koreensis]